MQSKVNYLEVVKNKQDENCVFLYIVYYITYILFSYLFFMYIYYGITILFIMNFKHS